MSKSLKKLMEHEFTPAGLFALLMAIIHVPIILQALVLTYVFGSHL